MKLIVISFMLAGAGGFVVHANSNTINPIEFNSKTKTKPLEIPLRDDNTFILAPHSPCDGPKDGEFDSNYINKECINVEKKWFKAI